ncbi:hypothetical protein C1H46_013423 [Malus baccata]|uniref:Uncharacterized protein n=1 Tax=Malus baccata TaxID=106549 RepID=A0A540MRK4_MALBA|nr:hypothetical protein C1H46_013423 [Malus baccata]
MWNDNFRPLGDCSPCSGKVEMRPSTAGTTETTTTSLMPVQTSSRYRGAHLTGMTQEDRPPREILCEVATTTKGCVRFVSTSALVEGLYKLPSRAFFLPIAGRAILLVSTSMSVISPSKK